MRQRKQIPALYQTGTYGIVDLDQNFLTAIHSVCHAITLAGYDPYSQLTGYLMTGNELYITRKEDARSLAASLDKEKIHTYIKNYL